MTNNYAPGTYVKGEQARVANTASEAVALVFDGFKPAEGKKKDEATKVESGSETESTSEGDPKQGTPASTPRPRAPRNEN